MQNSQSLPAYSRSLIASLDATRAISGFIVVVSHYFQIFVLPPYGRPWIVDTLIAMSEPAVLAFFVLSGYLIALSAHRNIEANSYFSVKAYTLSRLYRIYPPLIASIILCILLYGIIKFSGHAEAGAMLFPSDIHPPSRDTFSLTTTEVLGSLLQTHAFLPGTYLSANGPLWSLSHEVGFYILCCLAIAATKGRQRYRIVYLCALAALIATAILLKKLQFFHYLSIWLIGVAYYLIGRVRLATGLILVCFSLNLGIDISLYDGDLLSMANTSQFAYSILIACLIHWLASSDFEHLLAHIGRHARYTYTLYLIHFPIFLATYQFSRPILDTAPLTYFCIATLTLILTTMLARQLSYHLEKREFWEDLLKKLLATCNKGCSR